ncbi:adrenocorticotropic hormone receptor isoform X2 [Exaiptasia diaphana]|uniref:G-protein coupled receptors family 1 profile domain-containing protein n=1 Tax=Exaiptasia diaphana TaxID=2652724 RepID=A0A913YPU4_EXADI|nr:adrenocorticotropic hormone receptor isoform X2 [Exaiptasia diaphana]
MWKKWLFLVEAVAIVITNTITIVTFTRTPRLRMRKYYLIINLAVVDLLVGLVAVPLYFVALNEKTFLAFWIFDPFLGIASLLGLAAIAIERTYATYYPFKYRAISKTPYIIGIAVVWLTALLFTVSILTTGFVESGIMILTSISVPLVIIICAYFLIWIKLSCMRSILGHTISQRDRKLSVTLAIVTTVSLITWVPFMAYSVYLTFCYIQRCETSSYSWSVNIVHMFKLLHYGVVLKVAL